MLFSSLFITVYSILIAAVAGMCAGSFLLCAAGRCTNGEGMRSLLGRSHCDACGHTLGGAELVPIFSYIFLRGRCRRCRAKLSPVYPLSEALLAAIFVALLIRYDITIELLQFVLLASALFLASAVDMRSFIIPNGAVLFIIVVRVLSIPFSGDIKGELLSAAIGAFTISLPVFIVSLIMEKLLRREAMGGGDIKLFFAVGMYFDWRVNILLLIISCVLGIVFGIVSALLSSDEDESEAVKEPKDESVSKDKEDKEKSDPDAGDVSAEDVENEDIQMGGRLIPFGPSIAAAAVIVSLVGDRIINWYASLF